MANIVVTILACIFGTWAVVVGKAPAAAPVGSGPPPSVDCSTLIFKMQDCLDFLTDGSTVKKPAASCCSGFKQVLAIDPDCVCEGFESAAEMGLTIDMNKASTLPSACQVANAPPLSSCKNTSSATPNASPVNPPTPMSPQPQSPSTTTPPTSSSSSTAPNVESPAPSPSTGVHVVPSSHFVLFILVLLAVSASSLRFL